MTKPTKILLIVSIAAFATALIEIVCHIDIVWGIGKPIGAIFLGLFLISKILENESAKFDEEQASRANDAAKAVKADTSKNRGNARLTPASAHSR